MGCGTVTQADTETYVHRSGRTGRAFSKGTCVTFYTKQQEHILKDIERVSGNTFIRIGPPQPADLVRVCAKDALTKLQAVHTDMLAVFEETARDYLKDNGA